MRVSVFIATSLDGYIAKPDGGLDWLMQADKSGGQDDHGYKAFSDSVDCMVLGRNSFEMVLSFPEWSYEGKRVIVLSNSLKEIPEKAIGKIELFSGSLTELMHKLEQDGCKRLYIDGGKTIQSFLREALITDMTITTIPILLGEGIPLFGKTDKDIELKHVKIESFQSGFVQSTYEL